MKRIARYLPLCLLALGSIPFASAQTSFDLNMGFGSFHDGGISSGIDSLTGSPCTSVQADPNCQITQSSGMGGFFLGFGMDMLLKKNYGVGFSWDLTPEHQNYQPPVTIPISEGGGSYTIQYRQHFIDFNGIWAPINTKKVILKVMPGIGDAKTSISVYESECLTGSICSAGTQPYASENHFDLHFGVGVQIFVTDHIFIRPQFDYHYVPNLSQEFASDSAFGGMVWVGYSWGDR